MTLEEMECDLSDLRARVIKWIDRIAPHVQEGSAELAELRREIVSHMTPAPIATPPTDPVEMERENERLWSKGDLDRKTYDATRKRIKKARARQRAEISDEVFCARLRQMVPGVDHLKGNDRDSAILDAYQKRFGFRPWRWHPADLAIALVTSLV